MYFNSQMLNPRRPIKAKVEEVLKGFDAPLLKFTQTMLTVRQNSLPDQIKVRTWTRWIVTYPRHLVHVYFE